MLYQTGPKYLFCSYILGYFQIDFMFSHGLVGPPIL